MRLKKVMALMLAGMLTVSAFSGCGNTISSNAVGATLDGENISLGLMNFVAKFQQAGYDLYYLAYFGDEMWSQEVEEGITMEDSTKESVAENIQTMYLLEKHMSDYGVEITEEETKAIEEAAKKFISDNSSEAVKLLGATEEYVAEFLRLYTIQYKMHEAIRETADTEVSDDEAAQRTFSYITASVSSTTDSDGNTVDFTEDEQTAFAEEMEALAKTAKDDFEKAAEDGGYEISTYSYGEDESSMDEAVIAAADELKEGKVSGLITTDTSYYILRLDSAFDEEATEEKKEEIIEERKSELYTEVCDAYKEESKFEINEKQWKKVKFNRLFTAVATETEEETDTDTETEIEEETDTETEIEEETDTETEIEEETDTETEIEEETDTETEIEEETDTETEIEEETDTETETEE